MIARSIPALTEVDIPTPFHWPARCGPSSKDQLLYHVLVFLSTIYLRRAEFKVLSCPIRHTQHLAVSAAITSQEQDELETIDRAIDKILRLLTNYEAALLKLPTVGKLMTDRMPPRKYG